MKPIYTLEDLHHWDPVTPPAKLAVFGDPVEHSRSPQLHNPALKACGIDAQYIRIHVRPDELKPALERVRALGFLGVNCTIPHKFAALEAVDVVDDLARRLGAVNTIVFEDGKMLGFNSDGPGFLRALREEFSIDAHDLRILVLGAGGGAGRAVATQCAIEHCERLVLVNRSHEKSLLLASQLASYFQGDRLAGAVERLQAVPWDEKHLAEQLENTDLIVNATSLGMKRADPDLLPSHLLQPHHLVYDMVYSPPRTRLLAEAAANGARTANGLSMLLYQGAISFEHWFNREAPVAAMREGLLASF
jgi:shikimate dehydrogenase